MHRRREKIFPLQSLSLRLEALAQIKGEAGLSMQAVVRSLLQKGKDSLQRPSPKKNVAALIPLEHMKHSEEIVLILSIFKNNLVKNKGNFSIYYPSPPNHLG